MRHLKRIYILLSKATIQFIRSLEQKKYRAQHDLFVLEGDKSVREVIDSALTVEYLLSKPAWLAQQSSIRANHIIEIDDGELSKISFQKTPNQAIALVRIPHYSLDMGELTGGLSLYLDRIQDPGNLGTILRVADWFGIRHVLCGAGCADPFSPKTVQATMGAMIRVQIHQTDAGFFGQLKTYQPDFPVFGAFLDGDNLYHTPLSNKAVIVMGNESKGISDAVAQHVQQRLLIPPYPSGTPASESLNVATATAIICAEFRRLKI